MVVRLEEVIRAEGGRDPARELGQAFALGGDHLVQETLDFCGIPFMHC